MDSPSFRSNNKENVLRASENIANVSLTSLNCTFGFNQSKLNQSNANDSFHDPEIIKVDNINYQLETYENQIKKLANDNIALRKKNKNLTELARVKEEDMIVALEGLRKRLRRMKQRAIRNTSESTIYSLQFIYYHV